jgi:hypothetical protein
MYCFPTHRPTQLHGNAEEDLERLKLEEAAMQRRKKLQDGRGSLGVANGGRLSADVDHFTLDQLQKRRKKLGEGQRNTCIEKLSLVPNTIFSNMS